ncbi:hypothetical protein RB595_002586 [Gaeumannomyces hyphopodioides]
MFRFWGTDSRGSEKTVEATLPMPLFAKPVQAFLETSSKAALHPGHTLKRRRPSVDETPVPVPWPARDPLPPKRIKIESCPPPPAAAPSRAADYTGSCPEQAPAPVSAPEPALGPAPRVEPAMERAKDVIQFQLGLEILYKHDELRLINQELAKCQVALEQLRRCHLIPYPVTCPTPDQMVEISSGKGPAMRTRPGEPVPEWAPPFGVVDGPYARHYAKWLIPDPKFDGILPEWQGSAGYAVSSRSVAEGRTTRNSGDAGNFGKQRTARGSSTHKLHALSSGYAQPKDKAGPCVLKRSDGKTVKLVCIDCHRENFSSTQGFINHCRIAHKRDFKSHEEAAVHCGHPIEVDELGGSAAGEEKPAAGPIGHSPSNVATGAVYPYARANDVSEQEALTALRSRVEAALRLYEEGKSLPSTAASPEAPPAVKSVPKVPASSFVGASDLPHLSRLLKGKNFTGDLNDHVADAKTREDTPDMYLDGDSDAEHTSTSVEPASPVNPATVTRGPGVMRIPARAVMAPSSLGLDGRPASSKGCVPQHLEVLETPITTPAAELPQASTSSGLYGDEMDVDLSPSTMASNNAPSLVSDDGEYDDSDDGSSSDASDNMDTDSVTEIKLEDDHEVQDQMTPRAVRKGNSNSVSLKKDESRHVAFVSPVRSSGKDRRRKQVLP